MTAYCPILATLAYVVSPDRTEVLLIHRNKRPDDLHFGKYNGLGGKVEPTENIIEGVKREIFEEAELIVRKFSCAEQLAGLVLARTVSTGSLSFFASINTAERHKKATTKDLLNG
ncbi:unnamed protein product [Sphagnum balticum]